MRMEITQSVTSRRGEIPPNYIPISSFGCHKGNTGQKGSEEYKVLYRAWIYEQISGIKLMKSVHDKRGQIFVDPADADHVIAQNCQPKTKSKLLVTAGAPKVFDAAALACESLACIDTTLDEICRVLERLATAVESVATQPKERGRE